jgi:lysophospholipase L1-like esterase
LTPAADSSRLALKDGDRVVWIGGTILEHERIYGYWETMLTASFPKCHLVFRNLGWAGDTVWAESRGMFDPPEQGYARMIDLAKEQKPTLIILAYGANEAFAGPSGIDRFVSQYRKLVGDLQPTGARFAFLLPMDMDASAAPAEGIAQAYNQNVETYRAAIRELAKDLGAPVIDLSKPAAEETALKDCPLSSDGVQLTACGYWATAYRLRNDIDVAVPGVELSILPTPYPIEPTVSSSDLLESLRKEIVTKNELFFHRWRPQNFTYIFGFRKHEQGNNAVEIPQFDPLIEKHEQEIATLQSKLEQPQ